MSPDNLGEKVEEVGQAADAVASRWKTWATIGLILAGLLVGGYLVVKIIF